MIEKLFIRTPLILITFLFMMTITPLFSQNAARWAYDEARLFIEQNELDLAKSRLLRSVKLAPDNPSYKAYLGWFYMQHLDNAQEAIRWLEEAQSMGFDLKTSWGTYARSLAALNRFMDAASAYQECSLYYQEIDNPESAFFYKFKSAQTLIQANHFEDGFSQMLDVWNNRDGKYRAFYEREFTALLYARGRKSLVNRKWDEAKRVMDLLQDYLQTTDLKPSTIIQRFPSEFYRIDYPAIITQLSQQTKMEHPVSPQFLLITPPSESTSSIAQLDQERYLLAMDLFVLMIEYLSKGQLMIEYNVIELSPEKYRTIVHSSETKSENWGKLEVLTAQKTANSLLPALRNKGITATDYDTLILFFSPYHSKSSRASASMISPIGKKEMSSQDPKIAFISIPIGIFCYSEGIYLHEYFHILENQYKISPKHGFSPDRIYTENKRIHFPEWKGEGQFSYYKWHFDSHFTPKGYGVTLQKRIVAPE